MPKETSPIDGHGGRTPLRRDTQQWVLDYVIQETGKTYHFQGEGRGDLPKSVKSHAMIAKHVAQEAQRLERFAATELDAGHRETALRFFFDAALTWLKAQHPVFHLNDEKRFLYAGARRCYDRVCELAPYRLEHLDFAWEGQVVSGNLHLNPDVDGPAPLLFYIPGCDAFKEAYPHPYHNFAHQRGFHMFSFDGPGQAECNLRGIVMTADNYERAATTVLTALLERPEIDADQVVLYANSFGSVWGLRFAELDPRIKAVAATQVSICEKYIHTDLESPRWKQLLAYLTQAEDEDELDTIMRAMTMDGHLAGIRAPVLMTVGEYDPRAPLEELYPLFDQLTSPSELWVMTDQHHNLAIGDKGGPQWGRAALGIVTDWLRDRLEGKALAHPGEVVFVPPLQGPNSPAAMPRRTWYQQG